MNQFNSLKHGTGLLTSASDLSQLGVLSEVDIAQNMGSVSNLEPVGGVDLKSQAPAPKGARVKCYVCEICGKEFGTWTGRYYHMAIHTGNYKIFCDLCDKGFMKNDAYKRHLDQHRKQIQQSALKK